MLQKNFKEIEDLIFKIKAAIIVCSQSCYYEDSFADVILDDAKERLDVLSDKITDIQLKIQKQSSIWTKFLKERKYIVYLTYTSNKILS